MSVPGASKALHVGRSWHGHVIEDMCPCPQVPCGLVRLDEVSPYCDQHTLEKTLRQGHSPERCPGGEFGL